MRYDRKKKSAILFIILMAVTAGLSGCGSKKEENNAGEHRISVAATLFPYYDFVRAVGGDLVDLELILPPGQESHSFEPTASDLIKMEKADILVYNGGESEQWVERVLEAGGARTRITLAGMDVVSLREEESSQNMEGHEHSHAKGNEEQEEHMQEYIGHVEIEYDEHIWTSPVNAILLVNAVRDTLIEAAPEYQEIFMANAENYTDQLKEIDKEIRQAVEEGKTDILVFADRFPFLYFVKEYGLRYDAAFAGCGSDTEPSAATIAGLIDLVKEEGLPAVYHVEQSSRKTAKIIQESTGVEVLELHSCHNVTKEQLDSGVTYVELMKENIKQLRKGLGC